jgi:hypothetical protein
VPGYRSPVPLIKFQVAPSPTPTTPISSRSKKKEPKYLCLSEAKASHSHKMCTEFSSSVPHFLQAGSLLSPITCRCLLRVLCPVSRPITALVCVLLKDRLRSITAFQKAWRYATIACCIIKNKKFLYYRCDFVIEDTAAECYGHKGTKTVKEYDRGTGGHGRIKSGLLG